MKILNTSSDKFIVINNELESLNDLGWAESFIEYEDDLKNKIINSIENYETIRYIHEPYNGIISNPTTKQSDIWFYFYFIDNGDYVQNYEPTGLSNISNSNLTLQTTNSFFRLEFYKTLNEQPPERANRKLVFAKNIMIPSGEKFYLTLDDFNDYIYVPVFYGSNYANKENMYLFWFEDNTPYVNSQYSGNTFWMTAKYFNSIDGSLYDFVNDCYSTVHTIVETQDFYYKVIMNQNNYTYSIYQYNGIVGDRVGTFDNPIKFYEKGGGNCL